MTDRELLELAARAAGIEGKYSEWMEMGEQHYAGIPQRDWGCWNPLTDDGDALRLAVKLRLLGGEDSCLVIAMYESGDPYAATRRAIVRAAAEIGLGIAQSVGADLPEDNYYKTLAEDEYGCWVHHPSHRIGRAVAEICEGDAMTDHITLRRAAEQALEALEYADQNHKQPLSCYADSIAALRAALAKPAPSPEDLGYVPLSADGKHVFIDGFGEVPLDFGAWAAGAGWAQVPQVLADCWCHRCNPGVVTRMIVCPTCGNKRCPHASDHQLACTDSNESGQPGSIYPAFEPVQELVAWGCFKDGKLVEELVSACEENVDFWCGIDDEEQYTNMVKRALYTESPDHTAEIERLREDADRYRNALLEIQILHSGIGDIAQKALGMPCLVNRALPDSYCVTTPDGECVSTDPRCMHNTPPGRTAEPVQGITDTERLNWLDTLPCGITIHGDSSFPQSQSATPKTSGTSHIRDLIDSNRSHRGEK